MRQIYIAIKRVKVVSSCSCCFFPHACHVDYFQEFEACSPISWEKVLLQLVGELVKPRQNENKLTK